MAAEERFDAIISLGVEFDQRGLAALENAPEHVRAQLEQIIQTVANLGPAMQAQMRQLGQDGAAALQAGLESGLRQRMQGLISEAIKAATPLPGRLPRSGEVYGSGISGSRGNYTLAPTPEHGQAEMRYSRLVDAATAARQLQIDALRRSAYAIEAETRRYVSEQSQRLSQSSPQRRSIENNAPPSFTTQVRQGEEVSLNQRAQRAIDAQRATERATEAERRLAEQRERTARTGAGAPGGPPSPPRPPRALGAGAGGDDEIENLRARLAQQVRLGASNSDPKTLRSMAREAEQAAIGGSATADQQRALRDLAQDLRRLSGEVKGSQQQLKEETRARAEATYHEPGQGPRRPGEQTYPGQGKSQPPPTQTDGGSTGKPPPPRQPPTAPPPSSGGDDEPWFRRWSRRPGRDARDWYNPREGTPGNSSREQMGRGNPFIGAQYEDGTPRPYYRGGQQANGSQGFRRDIFRNMDRTALNSNNPLDFLTGGLNNMGQYLQYFGALSGSIAIFSGMTAAMASASREALTFQQATIELTHSLSMGTSQGRSTANALGDAAVATGLSPSQGVELGMTGVRRLGAQADARNVGTRFATEAGRLSVLDPAGKPTDYAEALGGIAASYHLDSKQIGEVTNTAYIGFEKFGGSISEVLKGVERLAPTAKQVNMPLRDLVATVSAIQGRTGQGGERIASDMERALTQVGSQDVQKALSTAGIAPSPTGNPYENLQGLAKRLPELNQARQAQVLKAVGGERGTIGVMLREQFGVSETVFDSLNKPGAAGDAFDEKMKSVLQVARQVGAQFLNLGKDFLTSGILEGAGLLLATLKPTLSVLDGMVRAVSSIGNPFGDMGDDLDKVVIAAGTAYGLLRLLARTSAGASMAGVASTVIPGTTTLLGGMAGRASALLGPGLVQGVMQRRAAGVPGTDLVRRSEAGAGGPAPVPSRGALALRGGLAAAGAVAAWQTRDDPVTSGASAGLSIGLATGSLAAGAGVGALVFSLAALAKQTRETKEATEGYREGQTKLAEFRAGRRTPEETEAQIADLRAKGEASAKAGDRSWWETVLFGPDASVNRGKAGKSRAEGREQNAQADQLEADLKRQRSLVDDIGRGRSSDFAGTFGNLLMQGSGRGGIEALTNTGFGGTARAEAWRAALARLTPDRLDPGTLGEIAVTSPTIAQAAGTAAANRSGSAVTGAKAALDSANADLNDMLRSGKLIDAPELSAQRELVDQLTNTLNSAVSDRNKALGALTQSYRAQDDVFGRHNDAIGTLRQDLQQAIDAHGSGSDRAVAAQTALNQELQGQVTDTAAATAAKFQATVDPRSQVETAAAQVQIAQRQVQNSTAGSVQFFQAQAGLRQAQVSYAQSVAESEASQVMANARPGSPIEQAEARIKAADIRIKALKAPLPKLADPSEALGLALDQTQDPKLAGINAGINFVTGVTTPDYKAVGAVIGAQLAGGALAGALPHPDINAIGGMLGGKPKTGPADPLGGLAMPPGGPGGIGLSPIAGMGSFFNRIPASHGPARPGGSVLGGVAAGVDQASGHSGTGMLGTASPAARALARASQPIGYDPAVQAAIARAKEIADAAERAAKAQAELAIRTQKEQAYEARFAYQAAAQGGGGISQARAQIDTARAQAAFIEREDPAHFRENPQWVQAQTSMVQGMQALVSALRENAKNIRLLSGDISDPRFKARVDRETAEKQLSDDLAWRGPQGQRKGADIINADRVAVAQGRLNEQSTTFDTNMALAQTNYELGKDARFANEQGRMGLSSYLAYLNSLRTNLLAVKHRTFEQQRELNEVDKAIQATTAQFSGQFNLGDIKVPTVYEVRRSVATSQAGQGFSDMRQVNITINGANKAEVVGVLRAQLGTPALARATAGKRV